MQPTLPYAEKVSEVIKLLELDGWTLKRTTGSHRHYTHRSKPGLVTVAGKPSATLKPGTEASIAGRVTEGAFVKGYVVVFEGDDATGFSAYAPDLPGVIAAADTREETEQLMREAMTEHIALLRQIGESVPEPVEAAGVSIVTSAA